MKVILDGNEVNAAGTTLGSALDAAQRLAGDRFIIEAQADGNTVPGEHLESPPDNDPYAHELVLTSADPNAMVNVMLHEAADLLDDVRKYQRSAGAQIQSGNLETGVKTVGDVLEGWSAVQRAMELAAASGALDADAVEGSDRASMEALVASLAPPLKELKVALEHQDWSGVSDALSYDLDEHAERWQNWLNETAESIRR